MHVQLGWNSLYFHLKLQIAQYVHGVCALYGALVSCMYSSVWGRVLNPLIYLGAMALRSSSITDTITACWSCALIVCGFINISRLSMDVCGVIQEVVPIFSCPQLVLKRGVSIIMFQLWLIAAVIIIIWIHSGVSQRAFGLFTCWFRIIILTSLLFLPNPYTPQCHLSSMLYRSNPISMTVLHLYIAHRY